MKKLIDYLNTNRWLTFIANILSLNPIFNWIKELYEKLKTQTMTFSDIDISGFVTSAITTALLLFLTNMCLSMRKEYKKMGELYEQMKEYDIISRALKQIDYEAMSIRMEGNRITTPQQQIQEKKEKLFKKLQSIYINLPDWKTKEKMENFFKINVQDEKL